MSLPPMPEYKENHMTLWREGKWVQVHMDEMPRIMEEDNKFFAIVGGENGTQESSDVSSGE